MGSKKSLLLAAKINLDTPPMNATYLITLSLSSLSLLCLMGMANAADAKLERRPVRHQRRDVLADGAVHLVERLGEALG
jgi:hypothetical protein